MILKIVILTACLAMCAISAQSQTLATESDQPSLDCSEANSFGTMSKQKHPQARLEIDSCKYWRNYGLTALDNMQEQVGYDTLKKFIEHCAWYPESWRVFRSLSGAATAGVTDGPLGYREWLKSVLYLNTTDPEYFCACADAFSYTYNKINEQLAVIRYLLLNTDCDHDYFAAVYTAERRTQYESWLSGDTTIPLDTTLPSIHDLGLDVLLLKEVPTREGGEELIATASVAPNPFGRETILRLTLNSPTYVTIEVFDEMGKDVRTVMRAQAVNAGEDVIPLDLGSLATGTYYLRVACGASVVRTIRMVRD